MQKGSDVLKKDVLNKRLAASLLAGVLTVTSIGGASLLTSTSYADDSNKETTQLSSSKEASTSKSTTKSSKSSKSNKSTEKSKTTNDRSKASKNKQNGSQGGQNGQGGPGGQPPQGGPGGQNGPGNSQGQPPQGNPGEQNGSRNSTSKNANQDTKALEQALQQLGQMIQNTTKQLKQIEAKVSK